MPTLSGKLTEKHNELVAKKEAARKEAEKLEKKKRDNARKKRSREVCIKHFSVFSSVAQLSQCLPLYGQREPFSGACDTGVLGSNGFLYLLTKCGKATMLSTVAVF